MSIVDDGESMLTNIPELPKLPPCFGVSGAASARDEAAVVDAAEVAPNVNAGAAVAAAVGVGVEPKVVEADAGRPPPNVKAGAATDAGVVADAAAVLAPKTKAGAGAGAGVAAEAPNTNAGAGAGAAAAEAPNGAPTDTAGASSGFVRFLDSPSSLLPRENVVAVVADGAPKVNAGAAAGAGA